MSDLITVQMRLKQSTIQKVKRLQKALHTDNRADAVRAAIDITHLITEEIAKGSKVTIYPSCWRFWKGPERIIIPPLNH